MRKMFILTILVFCIGLLFADNITIVTGQQKKSSNKKTKPTPTPKEKFGIESLTLSKEKVTTWCHSKNWSAKEGMVCAKSDGVTAITAQARIPKDIDAKYYYFVSGGKIIGDGENVFWDLSEAKPGTHTLTACIGKDNVLIGDPISKTITLEECDTCDIACECSTLSVTGPEKSVNAGDDVIFNAYVAGGSSDSISYKWSISDGTIVAGQGTPTLFVKTPKTKEGKNLTATVEITASCPDCPTTASATISITGEKPKN